jgi:hypothetical protein
MEILVELKDGYLFILASIWSRNFIQTFAAYQNEMPREQREPLGCSKWVTGDYTPVRLIN